MVKDIVKRPFITVGFTAFVLMIPLAADLHHGWIRRLGGKRWQALHRSGRHRGARRGALLVAGEGRHVAASLATARSSPCCSRGSQFGSGPRSARRVWSCPQALAGA